MHEYLEMRDVMREVLRPHLPNSFFAWLPLSIIPRPIFALDFGLCSNVYPVSLLTLFSYFHDNLEDIVLHIYFSVVFASRMPAP